MPKPPRIPFHAFRAAALATGTLTLAAGAHLAAGGSLPAPGTVLALLALTVLVCTAATRLRLGLPAITALLGGGQLALHEALTLLSTASSAPAVSSTVSSTVSPAAGRIAGAHAHDAAPLEVLAHAAGHVATHVSPADPAAAPFMLAAHALATLGCALLLAQGENALWHLAAWLKPLTELPRAAVVHAVPMAPGAVPSAPAPLRPWRNLRQDSRRGPPSAAVLSV
ncbi:hypothetical protein ACFWIX_13660 [Pseudarthrobacter sp. NPDC058362]|uniref:hypothetical protein n=1 Tax=Pseudarthrobacter sp. NPDC058362 TaxID=3346458 RepID=UPI0036698EE2